MPLFSISDRILQSQDKDGMLRRALERIIQLYTDKSHFVYELLQNAEDAGATKIKFDQRYNKLVVMHDGHPFSVENLQGLCDIGKSDKTDDLNQIGEFGVGFKSVFGICEKVRLYSHPRKKDLEEGYHRFAVEIRDFTHPVDIEDEEIDPGYTTKFVFPYSVGFTFSGFESTDRLNTVLSQRLQNLGITTLLFMKNLQSIDYDIEIPYLKTSGSYVMDKIPLNDHCHFVSAVGETGRKKENEEVSYLVFSREVTGMQAGRSIDIAFAVDRDDYGNYSFKQTKSPFISVYFPTETESKLKFIVQGPYRTTPNRSSVPADDKDNIDLAKQTASLLRDSVIELRDTGKLNFSFLNILPVDQDVFYSAPLFECMFDETKSMLSEEALLLCKDGSYAAADSVKISRGNEFSEVLTDDLLTELLNDGTEYHWLPTFLTETNKTYKDLYEFLTDTLDIEVLRPENMRNAFNENRSFLPKRDDDWLVKLYNMYDSVAAAFSKQRGGSNMLTAAFIKTSKGNFIAPYRKSDGQDEDAYFYRLADRSATYLPNIFLPTTNSDTMHDLNFVDPSIFERCRHFFVEILGIQRPNEYEFFVRDFKTRYENAFSITDNQHITDLKRLLHYKANPNYADEINTLISKYLKVRCMKDGSIVYVNPSEEHIFFPTTPEGMSIKHYYANIESHPFVDIDFYELEEISDKDLLDIGVIDTVAVGLNKVRGEYYTGKQGRQPEWHTSGDFRWKLSLDKLDEVLEYISSHPKAADSMAKSSFILRFLLLNENMLTGFVMISGSTPSIPTAYSDIVTKLRRDGPKHKYYGMKWDGKWLYTESGDLVSQKEISKRELNPHLYGEVNYDSEVYEMLDFLKKEEDYLDDAARDYDELDEGTKERYFEIELQRRYGISKADLDSAYGGMSSGNGNNQVYVPQQDSFEFPSARVKNWDTLRKHAAEVLSFAAPTKYEYKLRKIRVSRPDSEIDAYLKGMYKVDGAYKYACQMCHEPVNTFEKCQLAKEMEKELDPMYLCMCPNCASQYRQMRNDDSELQSFIESIKEMEDYQIGSMDPVKVDFENESIWFTQTHIAEIRELLSLRDAIHNYKESDEKPVRKNLSEASSSKEASEIIESKDSEQYVAQRMKEAREEDNDSRKEVDTTQKDTHYEVKPGTDVYKDYIGKEIKHKVEGYGTVTDFDGKCIYIVFKEGPKAGSPVKYSLEMCLSKGLIEII